MKLGSLLVGLGVGAGLMYLLDPDRGTGRRALVRDQATHYQVKGTRVVTGRTRHLRNRALGLMHELRRAGRREEVADEVLVARVRSKMGLVVSRPRQIGVMADNGKVILSGEIHYDEVDNLLETISAIPGVQLIENRLEEYDETVHQPPTQRAM
jgi:hypothetical protein